VNADWNTQNVTFTVQDPCQLVRKSLGDAAADDLRFVTRLVVGEQNLVEMRPGKSNNYCCGGGGGALQAGYPRQRRAYGRRKAEQIEATGARYVVAPCHNCHAQIGDLAAQTGGIWRPVHLWTLICLSLGLLGENEQEHLGEDLRGVCG
jgi:Fe-S oxidoreductase